MCLPVQSEHLVYQLPIEVRCDCVSFVRAVFIKFVQSSMISQLCESVIVDCSKRRFSM